jgi:hypothetical protein
VLAGGSAGDGALLEACWVAQAGTRALRRSGFVLVSGQTQTPSKSLEARRLSDRLAASVTSQPGVGPGSENAYVEGKRIHFWDP